MAAATSGTKTVTKDVAPHLTAASLTTLLATPVELLTVAQFHQIRDALQHLRGGDAPGSTIGALLI